MSWQLTETVPAEQDHVTLRELLQQKWLLPKRFVHYLRVRQNVLVNHDYQSMNYRVHAGDVIQLNFLGDEFRQPRANCYVPTADPQLQILFENRDLMVVNKPRGQKTHPNYKGEPGTLLNDATGYLHQRAYMVHRIDQQTSGAVIIAKNPIVVPVLDRLIAKGRIHRQYVALVEGQLTGSGQWSWPIGADSTDLRRRRVNGVRAQRALTYYQSLSANDQYSLVQLTLATGRTHQLRVHLAYSGHPIVGDPIYNPLSTKRMLLHGIKQQVVLPFSMKEILVQAPLPTYFRSDLIKYHLENKL